MKPSINIENLSIGYHNNSIIEGINIDSSSNKLIGVIGRNGKGKSTLLKTIAGILQPIKGRVCFNTNNIYQITDKERAKLLSIVLTHNKNLNDITVSDFVSYGRYPYTNWFNLRKEKDDLYIQNALQLCGVNHLNNRYFNELSDGEKQKENIARVLAQNTPFIILDEPTAHLDLINKVEVLKLLKELSVNQEKMIIISTHQIELALQLCDEIWFFDKDAIHKRKTDELIQSNEMNNLFESNNITFNPTNRSFEVK